MKSFVIAIIALSLIVISSPAFSAEASGIGYIGGQNGETQIIGPVETISLVKDPIVTKRTVSFFGMTITYIDTLVYWTSGPLCYRTSVVEIRDSKGRLISSSGTARRYDGNGKIISPINTFKHSLSYNRSGALSSEIYYSYNYDTGYKPLSSDKTIILYTYTAKGELQKKTSNAYFYDSRGKQVSSSANIYSYTYNEDGTPKQEIYTYEERGADNKIRSYSRNVTDYYRMDSGDTYEVRNSYDINGNLIVKTARIGIFDNGQTTNYYVVYVIGADGQVAYTHVYDSHNAEVGNLSGSGFMAPLDIIGAIRNPATQDEMLIKVEGDMYLNSDRQWDFSKFGIDVSGSLNIMPNDDYDIYVEGDMTMASEGTIDLRGYRICVTGTLNVNAGTIKMDSTTLINVGDALNLNTTGDIINVGSLLSKEEPATITPQGEIELINKMAVLNIVQQQQQQIPQGVTVSGSIAIRSQEMFVPQKD